MNDEILAKAKAAKSADELIGIAKESGRDITAEQAEVLFKRLSQNGELSVEELESAVGGCGDSKWSPTIDCDALRDNCGWPGRTPYECQGTTEYSRWACKECGGAVRFKLDGTREYCEHVKQYAKLDCSNCKWNYHSPYGYNRWGKPFVWF